MKAVFVFLRKMETQQQTLPDLVTAVKKLTESHDNLKTSIENLAANNEATTIQVQTNTSNISLEKFNDDLITTLDRLFKSTGLEIPDVAFVDAFRMGKVQGKRPVLEKFVSLRWFKNAFKKTPGIKKSQPCYRKRPFT